LARTHGRGEWPPPVVRAKLATIQILQIKLNAATAHAEALRRFYADQLGLPAVGSNGSYGFKAGRTVIEFNAVSSGEPFYHYALRVPRNRFAAGCDWLAGHAELLVDHESGSTIFAFEAWNAEACYAHDPCGNIVELIAHHELREETPAGQPFSAAELLGVCELGLVGADTGAMARALDTVRIGLWDGTVDEPGRLAFMGGRDGVLILSPVGRGWMPTRRPAEVHPTEAVVVGTHDAGITLPGTPHHVRTTAERR
jgi:catechol 2,3-dioxygenase-like lactoylglutathione lyase family enzyme